MALFGKGISRICAVAAAPTAAEMARQVRQALRETPTVELRLDWLRHDAERLRSLACLKKNRARNITFLATCRRRLGGGRFPGNIRAQLHWLGRAREAGCSWCDLEVETLREIPDGSLQGYAIPRRMLLSIHDFKRTPPLNPILNRYLSGAAELIKIAATAGSIADGVRLLAAAKRSKKVVAVSMGEAGLPARILALRSGSALTYAPVAEATAPGQVSLWDMKHLYRAHRLTRRTAVYGVIGNPIGHSLSPLMHNKGLSARRIDAVYLPFLVNDLHDFLKAVPELGVRGFSVTLPHKQGILKFLKECEQLAESIGAVNTVMVRPDGSLYGCNTDYVGVLRALEKKLHLPCSRVLIFGAGGSARAAAFALARAGAAVAICARREKPAHELALAVGGEVIPRRALRGEFFDAILNATPVGMHPHERISPLEPRELNCRIVMDLIYRPQRTELLKRAAQKGIITVSGVDMFLAQGIAQWEMWTAKRAPETVMRRAVKSALNAESESGNNKPGRLP